MKSDVVKETELTPLELSGRGKVRDVYDFGDRLLIVSTDRLSAFDVVLPQAIPYKGKVLNNLSLFWMEKMASLVSNHTITADTSQFPDQCLPYAKILEGRSVLVKKAKTFPVECVARGYLIGSGWKDYKATGSVCGISVPGGLRMAEKLPEPIFTPSTKAPIGDHDENISFNQVVDLIGTESANWLRDKTLELYSFGAKWAEERGIIIADTKFEFGVYDGERILIDEVLTPDSSRFWPKEQYEIGISPPSLDKQFVRDYLETLDWNKKAPAPDLPDEIVMKTTEKYLDIYRIITGDSLV